LDLNGDGILSLDELVIGIERYMKIGKMEARVLAESIFKRIDTNGSGFIDYS
jgi:Ca2+-binding EF-hand superfamily protein